MSNSSIKEHINTLLNCKNKFRCNFAAAQLSSNIKDAIAYDEFYEIDYEKYGETIIKESKVSKSLKDEIRQKFPKAKDNQNTETNADDKQDQNNQDENSVKKKARFYTNRKYTFKKRIMCKVCQKKIDDDPIYYKGYPYHINCVKCMKCQRQCNSIEELKNFKYITGGCFFCIDDYEEYQKSKKLSTENYNEYHTKNKENLIHELFDNPLVNAKNMEVQDSENTLITSEVIEDSIQINLPYEDFIPTLTFKVDKFPEDINFDELQDILGNDVVILNVERGCSIFKIAFLNMKHIGQIAIEKIKAFYEKIKGKLCTTVGKEVIGNLDDKEPIITVPESKSTNEKYNHASLNLIQNTHELDKVEVEEFQDVVLDKLEDEYSRKNWSFMFKHKDIFDTVWSQIQHDLKMNEFELVLCGQTVIANRHLEEMLRKQKEKNLKLSFFYHGTKLSNHPLIVKNDFLNPIEDDMIETTDDGWFGKGIYGTDNIYYAAYYANGLRFLDYNDRTHILVCASIYNESKVVNVYKKKTFHGKSISKDVVENDGIHHAFVGDSNKFKPILESDKDKNFISANEYVHPSKMNFIPVYSCTIVRKEYFILWKEDNLHNDENSIYLKELSDKLEVNVYGVDSVNEGLEIINRKKRNKIKLITNAGSDGQKLIKKARKIIHSDFVCLVFAQDPKHLKWITKMKNVLFTNEPSDFNEFTELELDKEKVKDFANRLEEKYDCNFIITDECLDFPLTDPQKFYEYVH